MALRGLRAGDMCGGYEIVRELGRGGMAIVYLATDPRGHKRAIKTLQFNAALDPEQVERFKREIRLLASIDEVHVVRFYEAGKMPSDAGGSLMWVALEYLEGQTLRQVINERRGRVTPEEVARWGKHVADGVMAAHVRGVIHRDLKPANVAIVRDTAKVFDFGIAKFRKWGIRATNVGTRLGTIGYMPPEQLAGQGVDERSDVFALGVVLYELASGKHPILPRDVALTPPEAVARCFTVAATPLAQVAPGFPDDLCAMIDRAIAKSPDERFVSMKAMRDALDASLSRIRASRRPLVMGQLSGDFPALSVSDPFEGSNETVPVEPAPARHALDGTEVMMEALALDEPVEVSPSDVGSTVAMMSVVDDPPAVPRREALPIQPTPADLAAPVSIPRPPTEPVAPSTRWPLRFGALFAGLIVGVLLGALVLALSGRLAEGVAPGRAHSALRSPSKQAVKMAPWTSEVCDE